MIPCPMNRTHTPSLSLLARTARSACLLAGLAAVSSLAQAGLFDDDEARRAIVDLRTRLETQQQQASAKEAELKKAIADATADSQARLAEATAKVSNDLGSQIRADLGKQMSEQFDQLRRSLLDLNNQLDALRADLARLRGQDELQMQGITDLRKDLADQQKKSSDQYAALEARLRRLEPLQEKVDGRDATIDPEEKRSYDAAIALMRNNDLVGAIAALQTFNRRFPASAYAPAAQYFLGNSQYLKGDLKDAITSYRGVVTSFPEHPRAPEALLAIGSCQAELRDFKSARRTYDDLMKSYPQSEAAQAARERVALLR
ncbi:MAG: tol-pal system protein YbgF [Pseudomonadota bacterium]